MSPIEQVLTNFNTYLKERTNVLSQMEMCVERRIRLEELLGMMQNLQTQLQKAVVCKQAPGE